VTRVGVLGGSFDPIHLGHLILAETAREQAGLDRVIFVPAGYQWRKADHEMTPAAQRLEMVRQAIADHPNCEVSTIEIEREGPSYTDVTLEALRDADSSAEFFFILGYDALADLPHWHAPQRVIELATLVVAGRPAEIASEAPQAALGDLRARIIWLEMPAIEISATDIRERVGSGRSIRYLVPDSVMEYIASNGLYLRSD
jgi:nicotinate-nucleotide adenylyltransferase